MNSSKLHIFFCLTILVLFATPTTCQPEFTEYGCDNEDGNYTINSQFSKNLHTLLTTITSNTQIDYGFYNLSVGRNLDIVNAVALCRGDIPTPDCTKCIRNATIKITTVCPNQQTAVGWYETCMLWYSTQNIFKGELSMPAYYDTTDHKAANPEAYNHTVSTLMTRLATEAALGDSRRKFATGEANVSSTVRVYGLLQCIPDMEDFDCLNCLRDAINYTLADCCYGQIGVEAAGVTCGIRFDTHRFYKSAVVLPPLLSPARPPPFLWLPQSTPSSTTSKRGIKFSNFQG